MENIFHNIVAVDTSFDVWTVFILLAWCLISEAGFSVPYVLESFWLLVGYYTVSGALNPGYVIVLWLTAQLGRQAGAFGLYRIARFGVPPLEKFFHKIHLDRFFDKIKARTGAAGRLNLASPFSVAFARLVGMRLPMMLLMAAKKRPGVLAVGVVISSVVFDGLYISLGAIFGSAFHISPIYMLLISLGILTTIYLLTFLARKVIRRFRPVPQPVPDTSV